MKRETLSALVVVLAAIFGTNRNDDIRERVSKARGLDEALRPELDTLYEEAKEQG